MGEQSDEEHSWEDWQWRGIEWADEDRWQREGEASWQKNKTTTVRRLGAGEGAKTAGLAVQKAPRRVKQLRRRPDVLTLTSDAYANGVKQLRRHPDVLTLTSDAYANVKYSACCSVTVDLRGRLRGV